MPEPTADLIRLAATLDPTSMVLDGGFAPPTLWLNRDGKPPPPDDLATLAAVLPRDLVAALELAALADQARLDQRLAMQAELGWVVARLRRECPDTASVSEALARMPEPDRSRAREILDRTYFSSPH